MEILGKLTKVDYWRWRFEAKDLEACQLKLDLQKANWEKQQKDLDIANLKHHMAKGFIKDAEEKQVIRKKEFFDFIEALEKKLGFELRNAAIDDYTLEVKKLD